MTVSLAPPGLWGHPLTLAGSRMWELPLSSAWLQAIMQAATFGSRVKSVAVPAGAAVCIGYLHMGSQVLRCWMRLVTQHRDRM